MKTKILDVLGLILFILWCLMILPFFLVLGGLTRWIRYIGYIKRKVHDQKPKEYWY